MTATGSPPSAMNLKNSTCELASSDCMKCCYVQNYL